jgi:PhnB protein
MAGIPLPKGYHNVNPYILVAGVEPLIEFLAHAFGAKEDGERELTSDGRIGHAGVRIGDSVVMLSEASEVYPARPCVLFAYTDDVDATYRAALVAGATTILEPTNQAWGDRVGGFHDPFDNRWWVATHLTEFAERH